MVISFIISFWNDFVCRIRVSQNNTKTETIVISQVSILFIIHVSYITSIKKIFLYSIQRNNEVIMRILKFIYKEIETFRVERIKLNVLDGWQYIILLVRHFILLIKTFHF